MAANQILTNATTTDEESDVFEVLGNQEMPVNAEGTWDGATLDLYSKRDNDFSVWTATGDQLTATEPYARMAVAPDAEFKLIVKNAGASTDLNAFIN